MEFDQSTAVAVMERPDGLMQKDTFDLSTAVPVEKAIPQLSSGESRYSPPLTDKQRAESLVELSYLEKGQKVPIGLKADWALSSPAAQMVSKNIIGGLLTGGIGPAYSILKGIANASSPNSDVGKMVFDSAYKGLAETQTVDNLGGAAAKAMPELPWQVTGTMGAVAEILMFMPTAASRVVSSLSKDNQFNVAFNNLRNSPKWTDLVTHVSDKVGQPIATVEKQLAQDLYGLKPALMKNQNYFSLLARNLKNSTGIDLAAGLSIKDVSPKVGQSTIFTDAGGIAQKGTIKAIEGERVTIDMNGKEILATLSQLSVPKVDIPKEVKPVEPIKTKPQDFATAEEYVASHRQMYHQTTKEGLEGIKTYGFKILRGKAGIGDELPIGINTKTSPSLIRLEGKEQLGAYLPKNAKVKDFDNREGVVGYLRNKSDEYNRIIFDKKATDVSRGRELDALEKEELNLRKNESIPEADKKLRIDELNKQQDELLEKWKKETDDAGEAASKVANKILLDEGIDAIYIKEDVGGVFGNQKTDNLIVLKEGVLKSKSQLTAEFNAAKGGTPPPPEKPTAVSPGEPDPYEKVVTTEKIKKSSTLKKDITEFVDKTFVPISTRLSKVDESLKDAIRQHAFKVAINTKADMDASIPFLKSMTKMEHSDAVKLDFALKNADKVKIDELVNKYNIKTEYDAVRTTLDNIYKRAENAGMDVGYIPDYFPRRIIDTEEYLKFLRGTNEWGSIRKALDEEASNIGRPLTEDEKAEVINSMIRGYGSEKIPLNKPSNVKERKIIQITPEMNAFYKDSGVSLTEYIKSMNDNIEARIFFGKEKNLENSIGNYVARLVDDNVISPDDEESVRQILKSYFDKRGTHGIVTGFKNFSYIATMGSPISAITQIGDLAFSLYRNGYFGTIKAAFKGKKITKQDIGLDLIVEEFTDASKSSKAVSKVFKMIGLDAMDAFGKEVLINGAFDRLSGKALKNDPELIKTLERVFKDKASDVLDDLKNQVPSDDVKYMLFSELADFQPIALSEMPEYYVRGGNMRIFYMLKSYTIKQIDVFHNEIFREKNPVKKVQNAFRLAAALALMGVTSDTIKDIILGRKTKIQDLVIDNMLRLVGFSKWQLYKTRQDGMFSTLLQSILPPVPFLDDMYKDAMKYTNKKKHPKVSDWRIWQRIPVVGKFYYWWFGGGKNINSGKKKRIRN